MKQRRLLTGLLLCLGFAAHAQQPVVWKPLVVNKTNNSLWFPSKQASPVKPVPVAYLNPVAPAADSYYQQCYGFFCKREWELQQKVKVPVKLRLGTYQTAQAQEGK